MRLNNWSLVKKVFVQVITATIIILVFCPSISGRTQSFVSPLDHFDRTLPFSFSEEDGSVVFLAARGVKQAFVEGYDNQRNKVFEVGPSLKWKISKKDGTAITDGDYFCIVSVDLVTGVSKFFGKLSLNSGIVLFRLPERLYLEGRDAEATEVFKMRTELMPEDKIGWMYYGVCLFRQLRGLDAKEAQKAKAAETLTVFHKALTLADDCRTKLNAIGYIASIYDTLDDVEKFREWQLRRAEDACADAKLKAVTYYSIGVGYWKCAYDLSLLYANKTKLSSDPFHARQFPNKKEREKFESCVDAGMKFIDKSLSFDPEYSDAYAYKSLLWREKQKSTMIQTERTRYRQEAEKTGKRAVEFAKKKQAEEQ